MYEARVRMRISLRDHQKYQQNPGVITITYACWCKIRLLGRLVSLVCNVELEWHSNHLTTDLQTPQFILSPQMMAGYRGIKDNYHR